MNRPPGNSTMCCDGPVATYEENESAGESAAQVEVSRIVVWVVGNE